MNDTSPPLDGYTIYDPIDPYENHAGPFFWKEENNSSRCNAIFKAICNYG